MRLKAALQRAGSAISFIRSTTPRHGWLALALQIAQTGTTLGLAAVIGQLLAAVVDVEVGVLPFWALLLLVGALALVNAALVIAAEEVAILQTEIASKLVNQRLARVATSLPFEQLENPEVHDRLERSRTEVAQSVVRIVSALRVMLAAVLSGIGFIGLLVFTSRLAAGVIVVTGVPVLIALALNSRATYDFTYRLTPADRRRRFLLDVLTDHRSAKEFRVFGHGERFLDAYSAIHDDRIAELGRVSRQRSLRSLLATFISVAGAVTGIAVLADAARDGRLSIAGLGVSLVATQSLASALRSGAGGVALLDQSGRFMTDLAELEGVVFDERRIGGAAPERWESLEIRDLGFTYPGTTRPVLSGIDLELQTGQLVAIVGSSGSGKTTLMKILAGLYEPTVGDIVGCRHAVTSLVDADERRRATSAVFQDFVRYELSLNDNVSLMGDSGADLSSSIELAELEPIVADLERRGETILSRAFDGGTDLSAGQWQRVAIARALHHAAPLMILDEPTAMLDVETEAAIFDRLAAGLPDRASVVVTHRLSTIVGADKIVVLEAGQIVEIGGHAELIAAGGRYAELFALQSERDTADGSWSGPGSGRRHANQ